MKKQLRKTIIAGNWKMNKNRTQTADFIKELTDHIPAIPDTEVVVCVPFTSLQTAVELLKDSHIKVGAQNVHFEEKGAYTGEVSADMLTDLGVKYVIIGHSERRQYFNETDETVNYRTKTALEAGLVPIMCVGELLSERESGITDEVLSTQIKLDTAGFTAEQMRKTVIAYEPVWAIGTGKTATAEQAGEACGYIRGVIAGLFDKDTADAVTIQYGGSMNAKNAAELLDQEDVDGGLIGGASLVASDFEVIVKATTNN